MSQSSTRADASRHAGASLRRVLLSLRDERCPYGCTYCFERFDEYVHQVPLDVVMTHPALLRDVDVVYPACDADFFALHDWPSLLSRVISVGKHVSISTKAPLTSSDAHEIRTIVDSASSEGQVVKLAVSYSCWDSAAQIEPRTPSPEARLRTMRNLHAAGLEPALTLKPILADVRVYEYGRVLEACRAFTSCVLVGDEWVSERQPRPATAKSIEVSETPGWTAVSGPWTRRTAIEHRLAVTRIAEELGYALYESDVALIAGLVSAQTPD